MVTHTPYQIAGSGTMPHHLSVGIVMLTDDKIALVKKADGSITLPRETTYTNESPVQTITRGVKEELGIDDIQIHEYLGSLITYFERDEKQIEKTTIYFKVTTTIINGIRTPESDEIHDEIIWETPKTAIQLLIQAQNTEHSIVKKILL